MKKTRILFIAVALMLCLSAIALSSCSGCNDGDIDRTVDHWVWGVEDYNGTLLAKHEYNKKGQIISSRYYSLSNVYSVDYSFPALEEVARKEYVYSGMIPKLVGADVYSRDYNVEGYMPIKKQYSIVYNYDGGKIVSADVLTEKGKTKSYDKYFYGADGDLLKIERYENGELYALVPCKDGIVGSLAGNEVNCTFDGNGNVTSFARPFSGKTIEVRVEYNDKNMPSKLINAYGVSEMATTFTYDEKLRVTTIEQDNVSYVCRMETSYDDSKNEVCTVGYYVMGDSGEDFEFVNETRRYNADGVLVYASYKVAADQHSGKWRETTIEWELSPEGECNRITRVITGEAYIGGEHTTEIVFEDGRLVKKETRNSMGYYSKYECVYDEKGNLIEEKHINTNGKNRTYEYYENGNTKSCTEDGNRFEYIESDVIYRFNRYFYGFRSSLYDYAVRIESKSGSVMTVEYDEGLHKTNERYESSDGLVSYVREYYPNGINKTFDQWEYKMVGGVKTLVKHTHREYDESGKEIN